MPAGRPLKFKTLQDLDAAIHGYFVACEEKGKPLSITGLSLALDMTRETLLRYEERAEFSDTIKLAKTRVENFYEERLPYSNAAGPIFALKNFGWKDSQDLNHGNQDDKPFKAEVSVHLTPAEAYKRLLDGDS